MGWAADYREADVTAVDTLTSLTEKGAASPGAFKIPKRARRITEVLINAGPDWTADTILGYSTAVHLTGDFGIGGTFNFAGPVGGTAGTTNVSPANDFSALPQRYHCNIPVVANGEINAQGAMMGEDCGSLTIAVQLVFDGPPGLIVNSDYREENCTAANTAVTLAARAGTASGNFAVPSNMKEIVSIDVGGGVKSVAGPLRTVTAFDLTGSGFVDSETRSLLGNAGGVQDELATLGHAWHQHLQHYTTNIGVSSTGEIQVQAQELEDDVGTIFAVCNLGYR